MSVFDPTPVFERQGAKGDKDFGMLDDLLYYVGMGDKADYQTNFAQWNSAHSSDYAVAQSQAYDQRDAYGRNFWEKNGVDAKESDEIVGRVMMDNYNEYWDAKQKNEDGLWDYLLT